MSAMTYFLMKKIGELKLASRPCSMRDARINEHNKPADARIAALTTSLNDLTLRFRRQRLLSEPIADLRTPLADLPTLDNLIAALIVESAKRTDEQKKLIKQHRLASVSLAEADLAARFSEYRDDSAKLKVALAAEAALKKTITRIRGLTDLDENAAVGHILRRGDYNKPGAEVVPGVVEVLAPAGFQLAPQAGYKTSGRRTAFARWLTSLLA